MKISWVRKFVLFICLLDFITPAFAVEAGWPQFRGPEGQGHAETTGLPLEWSDTENVVWKTDIPGLGHSSPVVEGEMIWVTTAIDTPASKEAIKRRLESNTGSQPLIVSEKVSLRAIGVHRRTGKIMHDVELMTEREPQWVHSLNSYASPTPIIENGRLYCHFGTYGTACLDTATGKVIWTNRDLRIMHENGPGSSPVLWRDLVMFHCDGSDRQFVAALHKHSGKVAWTTERSGTVNDNPQLRKAYGTPLIVERDSQAQLISPGADWLYGYDPSNGKELWKVGYGVLGFSIVPRPVAHGDMVYMCTSFMRSELLAFRFVDSKSGAPELAWRFNKQVSQKPSPLIVGSEIYFVGDKGGVATCLDAKTGEMHWQSRLKGNFSASPLYADGRIYFFSHEGVTTVIDPGTQFRELARNTLDGMIMASPAALDGQFIIRTDKALYCIGEEK